LLLICLLPACKGWVRFEIEKPAGTLESRRIKRRFLVETGPRAARQGRAASGYAELAGLLWWRLAPGLPGRGGLQVDMRS